MYCAIVEIEFAACVKTHGQPYYTGIPIMTSWPPSPRNDVRPRPTWRGTGRRRAVLAPSERGSVLSPSKVLQDVWNDGRGFTGIRTKFGTMDGEWKRVMVNDVKTAVVGGILSVSEAFGIRNGGRGGWRGEGDDRYRAPGPCVFLQEHDMGAGKNMAIRLKWRRGTMTPLILSPNPLVNLI